MEKILGIREMEDLAASDPGAISLAQGTMKICGASASAKKLLADRILWSDTADFYGSPDGFYDLRELLAKNVSRRFDRISSLSVENFLIVPGAVGGISAIFAALASGGGSVLIPEPNYPVYLKLAKLLGFGVELFSMRCRGANGWVLDFEKLLDSITDRTRLVIISNPSNPTGTIFSRSLLLSLAEQLASRDIVLVVDEAYRDFVYDSGGETVSLLDSVDSHDNLIVVSTFSKSFSMSGWRVGYLTASKHLISRVSAASSVLFNSPAVASQLLALFSLKVDSDYHRKLFSALSDNRSFLLEEFNELRSQGLIDFCDPQGGFFLFFRYSSDLDSVTFATKLLKECKVAVVPGRVFGPSGEGYLRLAFSREKSVVVDAVNRLVNFFENGI